MFRTRRHKAASDLLASGFGESAITSDGAAKTSSIEDMFSELGMDGPEVAGTAPKEKDTGTKSKSIKDTFLRKQRKDNPIVFLDVAIGGKLAGRFTIELRADIAPCAAENFRVLVTGERGATKQHIPLCYRASLFHRIVKDQAIFGGDIAKRNGEGRVSGHGSLFMDENFILRHVGPGVLSLVNTGPDTNNAQFMIPTVEMPWLDGKNVVFGALLGKQSYNLLYELEKLGTERGEPLAIVVITDCGQLYPPLRRRGHDPVHQT